jgi:two-component system, LytTR family, response regulator
LPDPAPAVVLVTAYDQYALRAFDAAALDYLLKPVEPDRLAQTVQRLLSWLDRSNPTQTPARPAPQHLLIPDRGRTHVIPVVDILWLEAADNYVIVYTANVAPLMRRTLAGLVEDLGVRFVRIHRRFAVALASIRSITPQGKGDSQVTLSNGKVLACSRQYRASLRERLAGTAQASAETNAQEKAAKG